MKEQLRLTALFIAFVMVISETLAGLGSVSFVSAVAKGGALRVAGESSSDAMSSDAMSSDAVAIGNNIYTSIILKNAPDKLEYGTYFSVDQLMVYGIKASTGEEVYIPSVNLSYELADGNDIRTLAGSCGKKIIIVKYQDVTTMLSLSHEVFVNPVNAKLFTQISGTSNSITVNWVEPGGATGYQLCYYNEELNKWYYYGGPSTNKIPCGTNTYTIKSKTEVSGDALITPVDVSYGKTLIFYIRAFYVYGTDENGKKLVVYTDKSEPCELKTALGKTYGVRVTSQSINSISLTWDPAEGADGYVVYRKANADSSYKYVGSTATNTFTDGISLPLTPATTYKYKVSNFVNNENIIGEKSDYIKTTTTPIKVVPIVKGGEQRVRLNWTKCPGSTGYEIYVKGPNDSDYRLDGFTFQGTYKYIVKGLEEGVEYSFKVLAYRVLDTGTAAEQTAYSVDSDILTCKPVEVPPTTTTAFNYLSLSDFKSSIAFESSAWFRKYINYKRSTIIPGASCANVAGFFSDRMCPQGMTFSGDYMLITAYDKNSEENSIIYVMDKGSGDYLTTIVLPDKVHAGGVAYDGYNVWVCHGEKMVCIRYSEIKAAVEQGDVYREVEYVSSCKVGFTASYCTYYKGKLWVGTFATENKESVYWCTVKKKTKTPKLKVGKCFKVPSRTQGLTFTTDGSLLLSRSYAADSTKNLYLCQLDYYKPTWKNGNITKIGSSKNSIPMPSMNEAVAIKGAYVYVCYESPAFANATVPMDRVCAFKKSGLLDKITR